MSEPRTYPGGKSELKALRDEVVTEIEDKKAENVQILEDIDVLEAQAHCNDIAIHERLYELSYIDKLLGK